MDSRELRPVWLSPRFGPTDARTVRAHPPLNGDIASDVAIVGGGLTGLTTAYLLAEAGKQVVLVDAGRFAEGETCRTTAHLTHVIDAPLPDLVERLGEGDARVIWEGGRRAIAMVETLCAREAIECDFQRLPGWLYTADEARVEGLERYAARARAMGFACTDLPLAGAPFPAKKLLAFPDQARFHPTRYAAGLLRALEARGVRLFEDTRIVHVDSNTEGARAVTAHGHELQCGDIVVAAHVPFNNRLRLHAKQASYRSYVIAVAVPKASFPDALICDTASPYHYIRLLPRASDDLVLVGGEDHKTGQDEPDSGAARFDRLRSFAHDQLGITGVLTHAWSGQIVDTMDKLPYIGRNVGAAREWVATGYGGDGTSLGTLAAHILTQRILGLATPWDHIFAPDRLTLGKLPRAAAENVDYPLYLLKDWFKSGERSSPSMLKPGEGAIFKIAGHRCAVSRDLRGELIVVTPICTHFGCCVHWNGTEHTWDCPCHGSRFGADGNVINGPAAVPLERYALIDALGVREPQSSAPIIAVPGTGIAGNP